MNDICAYPTNTSKIYTTYGFRSNWKLYFFFSWFFSYMLFPKTNKHKISVLIHSGCYNKIPLMGSLLTRDRYLLQFWRLGSPRSRCQHGQLRAFFLLHSQGLSLCPSYGKRPREPLFLEDTIWSLFF